MRLLIFYPLGVIVLAGILGSDAVGNAVATPVNSMTAATAARLLSLMGLPASARGVYLTQGGQTVAVDTGCSGLELLAIILPAMLAFPSPLRAKVFGATTAVLLVFPLNLMRVASLSLLLSKSVSAFRLFHIYFWQAGLVGCLFGFLLYWLRVVQYCTVSAKS